MGGLESCADAQLDIERPAPECDQLATPGRDQPLSMQAFQQHAVHAGCSSQIQTESLAVSLLGGQAELLRKFHPSTVRQADKLGAACCASQYILAGNNGRASCCCLADKP